MTEILRDDRKEYPASPHCPEKYRDHNRCKNMSDVRKGSVKQGNRHVLTVLQDTA
jgi:hypothetical protein